MRILFSRELDETFRSDSSLWKKMGGAAFAAAFCALFGVWKSRPKNVPLDDLITPFTALLVVITAVAGAGLALMLSLKDVIIQRIERREPVNPILRLYFGMGVWSLVAWFPTAFFLGILLILATH